MNRCFVFTFYTHHDALVSLRCLREEQMAHDVQVNLIPVPRELSSSCGTAIKLELTPSAPPVTELLKRAGEYELCSELVDGTYQKVAGV